MTMSRILLVLLSLSSTRAVVSNDSTTYAPEEKGEDYPDKDETFQRCGKVWLEPDEYTLFPNGTIYVQDYNRSYTEPYYFLHQDSVLSVCAPEELFEDDSETLIPFEWSTLDTLNTVGTVISFLCLLTHLFAFAMVPDLKNMPGYNLASLCLSLLLAYGAMLFRNMAKAHATTDLSGPFCVACAAFVQLFLLSSFLWMFLMSLDVFKTILNATGNLRVSSQRFKWKKYFYNSLVAWGISSLFTVAALVVDNVNSVDESFKPKFSKNCWFVNRKSLLTFFLGPMITLIGINFLLFIISAYCIFANRMKQSQDSHSNAKKSSFFMYFRLFIIMGATWISGTLAPLANFTWLWYVFTIMNAFQGLFIFIAFTCSDKVTKFFKKKFVKNRRPSEQSLNPTFQSYCYSVDKDFDKMVDKSEVTDTSINHM